MCVFKRIMWIFVSWRKNCQQMNPWEGEPNVVWDIVVKASLEIYSMFIHHPRQAQHIRFHIKNEALDRKRFADENLWRKDVHREKISTAKKVKSTRDID